jgi:hypothetical protein
VLSYNDDSRKTIVVVTNGQESLTGNGSRGLSVQCNIFLSCVHLREPYFLPGFVEKFAQLKFGCYVLCRSISRQRYTSHALQCIRTTIVQCSRRLGVG